MWPHLQQRSGHFAAGLFYLNAEKSPGHSFSPVDQACGVFKMEEEEERGKNQEKGQSNFFPSIPVTPTFPCLNLFIYWMYLFDEI